MIQKIKLDFTYSVNLGSIILIHIDKKEQENKLDVPVGTKQEFSSFQSQRFTTLLIF